MAVSYRYRAQNSDGKIVSGELKANTEDELHSKLKADGMLLMEAKEIEKSKTIHKKLKYDRIASEVVRYIVNYDINNNIECNDISNKKLLALIERKKLETLLGCESQDIVCSNQQVYDIANFLDIADTIVNKILGMLSNSNTFIKLNYEYDIKNNIRAKKLVNIMSASYISNKLSN